MVATSGAGAIGIAAWVGGAGKATVVNHGTVTTTGDYYDAGAQVWRRATGIQAYSTSGEAEATNKRSGIVSTSGDEASGVVASTDYDGRLPTAAKKTTAINRGTVTTRGSGAYGMGAFDGNTVNSESTPHPATVYALNEGTVTTEGMDAPGVAAYGRMGHNVGGLYHGYGNRGRRESGAQSRFRVIRTGWSATLQPVVMMVALVCWRAFFTEVIPSVTVEMSRSSTRVRSGPPARAEWGFGRARVAAERPA